MVNVPLDHEPANLFKFGYDLPRQQRLDPRVLDAMMPFLTDNFANEASTHPFGVGASENDITATVAAMNGIVEELRALAG